MTQTNEVVAVAEGIVKHKYSDGEGADRCICCEGVHRYASKIEGIEDSGCGWLHLVARNLPDGARVQIVAWVLPGGES